MDKTLPGNWNFHSIFILHKPCTMGIDGIRNKHRIRLKLPGGLDVFDQHWEQKEMPGRKHNNVEFKQNIN
ncbi:hypothetical protein [Atlantibacter hermannii]|uniref:hypothetical protein n=1 Tax=Atlantibacter hermannii TaxID=565 RepID=UPI0005C1DC2E|nr:hypothetical protein [Atlantibacter hermannii]KIU31127.1 hypothetical protein SR38_19710 [Atlantibacter hermannii]